MFWTILSLHPRLVSLYIEKTPKKEKKLIARFYNKDKTKLLETPVRLGLTADEKTISFADQNSIIIIAPVFKEDVFVKIVREETKKETLLWEDEFLTRSLLLLNLGFKYIERTGCFSYYRGPIL